MFEQLLYDVYGVCGWFVWTEMQGLKDLKILVSKLKSGGLVDNYGFFESMSVVPQNLPSRFSRPFLQVFSIASFHLWHKGTIAIHIKHALYKVSSP